MKNRWTEQEIKEWYDSMQWLRGSNFLPSNCVNRLDMWQSYGREEHLKTADRELALCKEIGFNTVRLWLNFDVYYKEPEEFMVTLESYISLSAKHNQGVMLVLVYEEDLPYEEKFLQKIWGNKRYIITILTAITNCKTRKKKRAGLSITRNIPKRENCFLR